MPMPDNLSQNFLVLWPRYARPAIGLLPRVYTPPPSHRILETRSFPEIWSKFVEWAVGQDQMDSFFSIKYDVVLSPR